MGKHISWSGYISETVRYKKLIFGRNIGWGWRFTISYLGVTFDLGSFRMPSTVIFETYFSYHKDK